MLRSKFNERIYGGNSLLPIIKAMMSRPVLELAPVIHVKGLSREKKLISSSETRTFDILM